ncbi:kinetochore protein ndc80 [Trichogramma pretiosum]|uniref:kinetochore protein ndc80 n=1 Tax=Trichogramma pretiosum TaxID=7493 RepID=UPI0006C9441A|nr:kinetochore protein ndc80 [Trichogramma pretiosum]
MRKSSASRRRSSSNPGRISSTKPNPPGNSDTMIPKPRIRSFSTDRLSGMRKSNLRPTTGAKLSMGTYSAGSSAISPMPNNRYTHLMDKNSRPSLMDQGSRGRPSTIDQKGYTTPKASSSRPQTNDGRNVRASSAERASQLAPKGPKKDHRPLNDKNYQNEMVLKVERYFQSIDQSTIITNNIKPLTLKTFVEATNLLVRLLDIKQALTINNYIEEIPKIAKKLHYPGSMTKSWLKTAYTMHSWPHAIGWLSWLVELCEVKDLASELFILERLPIVGETEEERENRRHVFSLMIQCYKAWNEENPQDEERIMTQFFDEEANRRGINLEKYDEAQRELQEVQEQLKKEQAKTDIINEEVNELKSILNNMKIDYKKQQEHMVEQQRYIEKNIKEIDQFEKDSMMFVKDIENLEKTRDELRSQIKQQPMSVSERDEIVKACTEQQTYIQNFEVHLEEIKKESYSIDIKLVSSNTNLVKAILAYNQALFMEFNDSNINVDKFLMPENGICGSDFMEILENKKALMNEFMRERTIELNKKVRLLESHNKEIEALQAKRDALSEKLEKKKATDQMKKQEINAQENKKKERLKKLQKNIAELNEQINLLSAETEKVNQEIIDLTDKKDAVLRKYKHMNESAKTFFSQVNTVLNEHRGEVKKSLEKCSDFCDKK